MSRITEQELLDAVIADDVEAVEILLRKVKADVVDVSGRTALALACDLDNTHAVAIAELLLKKNAKVDGIFGHTPLWLATRNAHSQLVKLLLKYKAKVDRTDPEFFTTPLHCALQNDNVKAARYLLRAGANANICVPGPERRTPLISTAIAGQDDMAVALLRAGASLDEADSIGFTALHYCVVHSREHIAQLVLRAGCARTPASSRGLTPLTVAIIQDKPRFVELLVSQGANPDDVTLQETPLETALRLHSTRCAQMLLCWGCALTSSNAVTYFRLAADEGQAEVLQLIIRREPMVLHQDWFHSEIPSAFYSNLGPWLCLRALKTPVKLKDWAVAAIYKHFGTSAPRKLRQLGDDSLRRLLDIGATSEHKLRMKMTKACPLFCPPNCVKEQCVDVEFTDSESECGEI